MFFYDGTVECFHGNHLVMFIISSIVLVFFVIVPPVAVFLISTGRSNAPLAVMDALGKGLRYVNFGYFRFIEICISYIMAQYFCR